VWNLERERTVTQSETKLEGVQDGFTVPQTFLEFGGLALLATAVLEMVAGLVQAITESVVPLFAGGQTGRLPVPVPQLTISLADRLSIFVRSGANMTVALLLLVAIVAVAARYTRDGNAAVGRGRALMLVGAILASTVILANLAVALELLRNATGVFSGFGQTNRVAGLLQCLAPVALSIGVLSWAGTAVRD
jgi:hypothetical protein